MIFPGLSIIFSSLKLCHCFPYLARRYGLQILVSEYKLNIDETLRCNIVRLIYNRNIEKRGKKEDAKLARHIGQLKNIGTYFVKGKRIINYGFKTYFYEIKKKLNGLQLSDLLAYHISRYIIDPKRANPAYDILSKKFYSKNGKTYGLKVFP